MNTLFYQMEFEIGNIFDWIYRTNVCLETRIARWPQRPILLTLANFGWKFFRFTIDSFLIRYGCITNCPVSMVSCLMQHVNQGIAISDPYQKVQVFQAVEGISLCIPKPMGSGEIVN